VIANLNQREGPELHSPLYKIKNILDRYKDVGRMTESGIGRLKGEERAANEAEE
jgi:hypothetical protein